MEDKSFFKCCQQALNITIKNATFGGFSINKAYENFKSITSVGEWSKEYLFERFARVYLAIAAAQAGMWSAKRRSGIYFDKDIENTNIQTQFVENAEKDANAYTTKAEKIKEEHGAIITKNGMDGQQYMDMSNPGNYLEEMSIERLIELILADERREQHG